MAPVIQSFAQNQPIIRQPNEIHADNANGALTYEPIKDNEPILILTLFNGITSKSGSQIFFALKNGEDDSCFRLTFLDVRFKAELARRDDRPARPPPPKDSSRCSHQKKTAPPRAEKPLRSFISVAPFLVSSAAPPARSRPSDTHRQAVRMSSRRPLPPGSTIRAHPEA